MVGRTVTVKLRRAIPHRDRRLTPEATPASGEGIGVDRRELLHRFEFGAIRRGTGWQASGVSNFIDEEDEERIQSPHFFHQRGNE